MEQIRPDFETEFPELHRRVYDAAFVILGQRTEAEDVALEALARAYLRWDKVADFGTPFALRVVTNLAIDSLRREKLARRLLPRSESAEENPDRVDLQRALLKLPRRQRRVVVLRYVCDLPESEVAAALGCSVGTVKSHASRGLATLRRLLTPVRETEKGFR
jgi:RNA polymerase sigma-70 factor (sigma-E family)